MKAGKVYLVGAGPGDPDLITVKGLRAIRDADVILYDRLINDELLAHAKPTADLIYCGKLPNHHLLKQDTINHFLIKFVQEGKIVTRLKGGDPFVFGRGGEEAEVLAKHRLPFEIIPGITSGIAAPAYAGIPVTHREHSGSFALITGHRRATEPEDTRWKALATGVDTIAIYMGVKNLPYIREQLLKYGRDARTPTALIHWGTTRKQQTVIGTLNNIVEEAKRHHIKNPAMIVIGEVVKLSQPLAWFDPHCQDEGIRAKLLNTVI